MKFHRPIFRKLLWITLVPAVVALVLLDFLFSGYIRIIVPPASVAASMSALHWRVVGIGVVAAISAIAMAYLFSQSLTRRIGHMREFAEDLGVSKVADILVPELDDELGALARSLHRMSNQLRDKVDRLRDESARRDTILASMVEAVLVVDHELRVTFYNNSFQRLIGMSAPVRDLVPIVEVVRDAGLFEILRQVLASEQPVSRRLQLPAADSRIFEAYAGPLGGASGKGAIVILHDVTELERLERVRKDFVANVSHELRTPLTAIFGYAEALLDGGIEDTDNNRRFVEIIKAHAKRINSLASDLLTLSELESAKPSVPPERIPIRDALETALRTIEPEAMERQVRLLRDSIDDAEVLGYRVHFEQAVLNLLQNAVKFNRTGGDVRLGASAMDGHICITIADTGVGIPSEDLSRIFERFYRVDKARSREVGGTGLGLSIVKHAIDRMSGTVEVESQLGKGSQFKIILPVTGTLASQFAVHTTNSDGKD